MVSINIEKVSKDIKKLSKKVGSYQLNRINKKLNISKKSSNIDLVSEVDKKSEEKILNWIEGRFPKHSIVSEERGTINKDSEYEWVIDPLDGTTNYVHGFPIFSISIALLKNKEPIMGVIYVPYTDETFSAVVNKGAYLNGKKIMVSNNNILTDSLLVTGFPYNLKEDRYNNVKAFNKLIFETRGIRRIGSAAYDMACVASGRFDAFWELKLNPWDTKAGVIIIKEAKGKVIETDLDGHYLIVAGSEKLSELIYSNIKKIYK